MDIYPISQLLYDLGMGRVAPEDLHPVRPEVAKRYELDDEAVAALSQRDLPALWSWGIHPLLLMQWALATGVEIDSWLSQWETSP